MYQFSLQTEINRPLPEVIRLFNNRELYKYWQPGLVSDEVLKPENGKQRHKLIYKNGRRKLMMTETLLSEHLPHQYEVVYELKGIHHHVHHRFESLPNGNTLWHYESRFRFKGLMKWIATYMKAGLERQSTMIMSNFKGFAESRSK